MVKGDEIDVNVHPTKEEVKMLHESEIVEKICKKVDQLLINSNSNQQFLVKTINPFPAHNVSQSVLTPTRNDNSISNGRDSMLNDLFSSQKSESSCNVVRTDPKLQKLDPFLQQKPQNSINKTSNITTSENNVTDQSALFQDTQFSSLAGRNLTQTSYPPRRTFKLNSLLNLRKNIENNSCEKMREIIANCSYVGSASPEIAFVQHSTELWLLNFQNLCEQLFYQIVIYDFGNFGRFSFTSQTMTIANMAEISLTTNQKYKEGFTGNAQKLKSAIADIERKFCHEQKCC